MSANGTHENGSCNTCAVVAVHDNDEIHHQLVAAAKTVLGIVVFIVLFVR